MNSSINFSGFTDLLAQHAQEIRKQEKKKSAPQNSQQKANSSKGKQAKPATYPG